eukprot:gene3101-6090_t
MEERFYLTVHSIRGLNSLDRKFTKYQIKNSQVDNFLVVPVDSVVRLQLQYGWQSCQASMVPSILSAIWDERFDFSIEKFDVVDISVFIATSKSSGDEIFIGHATADIPILTGFDYSATWYVIKRAKSWVSSGSNNLNNNEIQQPLEIFLSISLAPTLNFFNLNEELPKESKEYLKIKSKSASKKKNYKPISGTNYLIRDNWINLLSPDKDLEEYWDQIPIDNMAGASQLCWILGSIIRHRLTRAFFKWQSNIFIEQILFSHPNIMPNIICKACKRSCINEPYYPVITSKLETMNNNNNNNNKSNNNNNNVSHVSNENFDISNLNNDSLRNLLQEKISSKLKLEKEIHEIELKLGLNLKLKSSSHSSPFEQNHNESENRLEKNESEVYSINREFDVEHGLAVEVEDSLNSSSMTVAATIAERQKIFSPMKDEEYSSSSKGRINRQYSDNNLSTVEAAFLQQQQYHHHLNIESNGTNSNYNSSVDANADIYPATQNTPNNNNNITTANSCGIGSNTVGSNSISPVARGRKSMRLRSPSYNNNNSSNSNNNNSNGSKIPLLRGSSSRGTSESPLSSPLLMRSKNEITDPLERARILLLQATQNNSNDNSNNNDGSNSNSNNVRVAIRMRPLNDREISHRTRVCVHMTDTEVQIIKDSKDKNNEEKRFTFDYCFDSQDTDANNNSSNTNNGSSINNTSNTITLSAAAGTQQIVFEKIGIEVLSNTWKGYNASLFAYGQTGSGKSYSMMGTPSDPGIIPRICQTIFYMIDTENQNQKKNKKNNGDNDDGNDNEVDDNGNGNGVDMTTTTSYHVEASYLEIYNENIRDLLSPHQTNLRLREHPVTEIIMDHVNFIVSNTFLCNNQDNIRQQTKGIPMGTNAGPEIANLTLYV